MSLVVQYPEEGSRSTDSCSGSYNHRFQRFLFLRFLIKEILALRNARFNQNHLRRFQSHPAYAMCSKLELNFLFSLFSLKKVVQVRGLGSRVAAAFTVPLLGLHCPTFMQKPRCPVLSFPRASLLKHTFPHRLRLQSKAISFMIPSFILSFSFNSPSPIREGAFFTPSLLLQFPFPS